MIGFEQPLLLLALPAPLVLRRLLPPAAPGGAALRVPPTFAARLPGGHRAGEGWRWSGALLPVLLWLCLVLTVAGPRQLVPVPALKVSGRDLAIALDLSGSMVRDDFQLDGRQVTRLEAVQAVGADFVRRRAGDRVALIVFGSEAYYAAPFTFDTEAVARRIEEAAIGISGRATNMSDALGLALSRMRRSDARSRVVILLSDGINNAGAAGPLDVARLARQMGVVIHTIAMGPQDAETAPRDNGAVDARTLAEIARISGGDAFRVRDSADLLAVTDAIDALETSDADGLSAEVFRPLWVWPGGLALLTALGCIWRSPA